MMQSRLIGVLGVLVAGVIVALVGRLVVDRLLRRLLPEDERGRRQRRSAARGVFVFLLVLTAAAAVSVVAPTLFADVPAQVLGFLPKLGVALVLMWLGAVAATLLGQLTRGTLRRLQVTGAELLAKVVYWTVLGLAILLAADQLGVETAAAQRLVFVSLALAGAAAALAVGLGGTALAGNVVAGRYVDDRFRVGERIEVGDYSGEVVEVGIASVSVAEQDGTTVEIPHSYLLDRPVRHSGGS
jgi:small-conductance mechanosensitive channel